MFNIAIIGGPEESEVKRLADSLMALKHPPLIIDTSVFPWQHHLSFIDRSWWYDDQALTPIKAFFLRSMHCNTIAVNDRHDAATQGQAVMSVLREKDSILGSLARWASSHGSVVLNPIDTLKCHFYKLDTLNRLRDANVCVPATLGTNDIEAIRRFARSHREIIYKPLAGGAEAVALSANDLVSETLTQFRVAPVMLQERIFGDDVRVYVLADKVIAAAALSTDCVDFRTGPQNFRPTTLTAKESADVIKAAKLMSLRFAGIDFKRTRKGEHYILDVNPAPMFAGFEEITGLDIARQVASYLVDVSAARVNAA